MQVVLPPSLVVHAVCKLDAMQCTGLHPLPKPALCHRQVSADGVLLKCYRCSTVCCDQCRIPCSKASSQSESEEEEASDSDCMEEEASDSDFAEEQEEENVDNFQSDDDDDSAMSTSSDEYLRDSFVSMDVELRDGTIEDGEVPSIEAPMETQT
jgi:hypothetical protein